MTKKLTDPQHYSDIADAIRGKNGSTDTYTPADMADAITNLPTGSGGFDVAGSGTDRVSFTGSTATSLDLSTLDTSSLTSFAQMFYYDRQLKTITGLENFDTSNVTDMSNMFYGCSGLRGSLDLSSWDTSKVAKMNGMFNGLVWIESINISGWQIGSSTWMGGMFGNCYDLETVIIGKSTDTAPQPLTSGKTDFIGSSTPAKFYVPDTLADGSDGVAAYKAATNWSSMEDLIYPQSELPS